jgi:hypothetical protein
MFHSPALIKTINARLTHPAGRGVCFGNNCEFKKPRLELNSFKYNSFFKSSAFEEFAAMRLDSDLSGWLVAGFSNFSHPV